MNLTWCNKMAINQMFWLTVLSELNKTREDTSLNCQTVRFISYISLNFRHIYTHWTPCDQDDPVKQFSENTHITNQYQLIRSFGYCIQPCSWRRGHTGSIVRNISKSCCWSVSSSYVNCDVFGNVSPMPWLQSLSILLSCADWITAIVFSMVSR